MKKLVLIFAVFFVTAHLGLTTVSAQEIEQNKEKVVTGTIKLMTPGSVKILDGYISNQLYTGSDVFTGLIKSMITSRGIFTTPVSIEQIGWMNLERMTCHISQILQNHSTSNTHHSISVMVRITTGNSVRN